MKLTQFLDRKKRPEKEKSRRCDSSLSIIFTFGLVRSKKNKRRCTEEEEKKSSGERLLKQGPADEHLPQSKQLGLNTVTTEMKTPRSAPGSSQGTSTAYSIRQRIFKEKARTSEKSIKLIPNVSLIGRGSMGTSTTNNEVDSSDSCPSSPFHSSKWPWSQLPSRKMENIEDALNEQLSGATDITRISSAQKAFPKKSSMRSSSKYGSKSASDEQSEGCKVHLAESRRCATRIAANKEKLRRIIKQEDAVIEWNIRFQKGIYDGPTLRGKVPHGFGIMHFENGSIYEGPFKNGILYGASAKFTSYSGAVYQGGFWHNLKHGYGEEAFKSGRRYAGSYNLGRPHGFGIQYARNGTVLHAGDWENGKSVKRSLPNASTMTFEMKPVEESFSSIQSSTQDSAGESSVASRSGRFLSSSSSSVSTTTSSDGDDGFSIYDDARSMYSISSMHSLRSLYSATSPLFDATAADGALIPLACDMSPTTVVFGKTLPRSLGECRDTATLPPIAADVSAPRPGFKAQSVYA
jgi:hypothetical protein